MIDVGAWYFGLWEETYHLNAVLPEGHNVSRHAFSLGRNPVERRVIDTRRKHREILRRLGGVIWAASARS